eukprot:s3117_g1.t1
MMHKSPLTEFEEIFSNTFQVQGGGLKRARPDSMEEPMETSAPSSGLAKGKGKGKSKKGGNSGRGRGRTMPQPMQGAPQSDHQGYGYMNQEWEPHYQPPWHPDQPAPYMQDLSYQVNTMSRLLMRHEMELMALRADTGFVMHLGAGTRGIIRQVFQASKEYHDQKSQQPRMQLTLKQTMLMTVFRTLRDRLGQWSAEKESLVPEEPPRMSPHAALKAHLSSILESLEESHILYQFNTIKRLTEQTDQTLPFFIKVSLQGAKAQDLFQRLLLLRAKQLMFGRSFLGSQPPAFGLNPGVSMTLLSFYSSTHLSRTLIAGTWGAAGSAPRRGLEVMDGGHTWPLLLAGRPASADDDPTLCDQCSLQDLFSHWHAQAEPRALIEPPAFCAVQVGRFGIASDGSCLKTGFQLQLEPFVHIPVFRANLQDVYFLKYHVRACAVHHGPTPSSGHYRSVLLPSDGAINKAFYTDDNATARKIKSSELVGIQRNAYIVFLQRTD